MTDGDSGGSGQSNVEMDKAKSHFELPGGVEKHIATGRGQLKRLLRGQKGDEDKERTSGSQEVP